MVSFSHLLENPSDSLLLGFSAIFVLGVGAQLLAWRVKVPAIIFLLATGFIAGPLTGAIDPKELFGPLLTPFVSLSVGLVLFEGALRLRIRELADSGRVLFTLLTVGAAVTWALAALGAYVIIGLPPLTCLLLGAVLSVTGPTVIGPMLQYIRPIGPVGRIAKWEGIVIDPIGAILAVLVFEAGLAFTEVSYQEALSHVSAVLGSTILVGGLCGILGALILVAALRRRWVPDHLDSPLTLVMVIIAFTSANLLQDEAGLLAVTLMGILLANQHWVDLRHIAEFKENVSVLLISTLFVVLAARLELREFTELGWRGPAFAIFLILVVRPVAVFLSSIGSNLSNSEKLFLSWLAPRGIVAASVSSVFAIEMGEKGAGLVPATFMVIAFTVVIYGATTPALARRLGLSAANPQGLLIVSAHAGARAIAHTLRDAGFKVLLVDSNYRNIQSARLEGLNTEYCNILSERAMESLDLSEIGRLVALTPNDEVNSLACLYFSEVFGRSNVFQLIPKRVESERHRPAEHHFRGRFLFGSQITYEELDRRFGEGAVVKATKLTPEFNFEALKGRTGGELLPLFATDESGKRLLVSTVDLPLKPQVGQTLFALVSPDHADSRVPEERAA